MGRLQLYNGLININEFYKSFTFYGVTLPELPQNHSNTQCALGPAFKQQRREYGSTGENFEFGQRAFKNMQIRNQNGNFIVIHDYTEFHENLIKTINREILLCFLASIKSGANTVSGGAKNRNNSLNAKT